MARAICTYCGRTFVVGNFQRVNDRTGHPLYCGQRPCQNARRAAWKRTNRSLAPAPRAGAARAVAAPAAMDAELRPEPVNQPLHPDGSA